MIERIKTLNLTARVNKILRTDLNNKTENIRKAKVTWEGIIGEKFSGQTLLASSKDASENGIPKGAEFLNLRQFTIVSKEELEEIAKRLGIKEVKPEDMHANLVLEGIPNLTNLPAGTRLIFPFQTVLYVTAENLPCTITGGRIQESNPERPGIQIKFPKESMHLRGLTAITLKPGFIYEGDEVKVLIPSQVIYQA